LKESSRLTQRAESEAFDTSDALKKEELGPLSSKEKVINQIYNFIIKMIDKICSCVQCIPMHIRVFANALHKELLKSNTEI